MEESKDNSPREAMEKDSEASSFRSNVIKASKSFKNNWVELGEFLTHVASEKMYETWGFSTFDEYCVKEVRIKKSTAIKLTNAWFFVSNEDPAFSSAAYRETMPDLDSIAVLQKARANSDITSDMYQSLRESALEKGQAPATLARKFSDMQNVVNPPNNEDIGKKIHQSLERALKNMQLLPDIPNNIQQAVEEAEAYFRSTTEQQSTPT